MIINNDLQDGIYEGEKLALSYLKKYERAKSLRENFLPLFEVAMQGLLFPMFQLSG